MNNTPDVSQDIRDLSLNEKSAVRQLTSFSFGNGIAERLGTPFLVPVFPRPLKADKSDIYTFALSREALLVPDGPLKRIDLQLVAMVNDARQRLSALGRPTQPKILITGFSASAMFASRFVFLHPDLIQAAAFGAVNSFFMVPTPTLSGQELDYPLGLADYQEVVGHPFDRTTYRNIPELAFMGANDDNDAVTPGGSDAYTAKEADLILNMFGRQMMPERWNTLKKVYASNPAVVFRTYSNIGHGLDERIWRDAASFLAAHLH